MSGLQNLVHMHDEPWFRVGLYGDHKPMHNNPVVLADTIETAVQLGAARDHVCVMVPASNETATHFQTLVPAASTTSIADRVWTDAVWTTNPDAAIALPTADCQTIVIKNLVTGMLVVAHSGKPAMKPGHIKSKPWWNILDLCIEKAIEAADVTNLKIYVTGAISGANYLHDDQPGQAAIQPFIKEYGASVLVGETWSGRLDLFRVTQAVASRWRIPLEQVTSDNLCTFMEPALASYRRSGTINRNIIVVKNQPVQL